ncbi:hypothetical protein A4R44_04184 [Amycolatopsis sp. M39]|nr:hypothetical protein A4R44_04184 [Amycolatopsis sp. M39]
MDQVVANIGVALAQAGATPEDVVRTVTCVAASGEPALAAAFTTGCTLVSVTCLGFPGQLVDRGTRLNHCPAAAKLQWDTVPVSSVRSRFRPMRTSLLTGGVAPHSPASVSS